MARAKHKGILSAFIDRRLMAEFKEEAAIARGRGFELGVYSPATSVLVELITEWVARRKAERGRADREQATG